jgi:hypothetical protein
MTIQEIQRLRNEHPFHPFRVLTADGKAYDVLHPEFMAQSPSGRFIIIVLPDDSQVMLDLLLVVGIQRNIKRGKNSSRRTKR